MKKLAPFLMTLLLLVSACEFEEKNKGYPKSIELERDGGTVRASGEDSFSYLLIGEGTNEFHSRVVDDTIVVSHAWLTAKSLQGSKSLIITATPNETNRKRKLIIYGYFGTEYAVINVTQKR